MNSNFGAATAPRRVSILGHRIDRPTHICAFFDSSAQEHACIGPFVAEGLDNGEQVFAIRDAAQCMPYVKALEAAVSRSFDAYVATGQLRLRATEETYLAGPGFEPDRMIEILAHVLGESEAAGYPRVRTCGDMGWTLRGLKDTDQLMEYEARVNLLTRVHDCTCVCVYDLTKFDGRAVMDVLSTHPLVVMGDRVYENPYYVEPLEFLERLVGRRPARPMVQTH
jgi:hypothetical protein